MKGGVRREAERLAAQFVTRQQRLDHLAVAFAAAVEQRERAVAQPEEAQHRRHAVVGAAQRCWHRLIDGAQRIHHHHHVAVGMEQSFRRAAGMAPIGQQLAGDFALELLQA